MLFLVILTDNVGDSSYESSPPFQMAGDDETETKILALFLFAKEGNMLKNALENEEDKLEPLRVLISNELKTLSE